MVITTVNRVEYNGDGINKAWPYTFRIIDATDIKLILEQPDGTQSDITSDYYVDTVNETVYYPGYAPGAEPPLAEQPPVVAEGHKLIVYRSLPVTQEKNLGEVWPFYVIELALDKLTMLIQDVYGWIGSNFMKLTSGGVGWDADNYAINNVRNPVDQQDAATKDYVDKIIAGIVAEGNDVIVVDTVDSMRTAGLEAGMFVGTAGMTNVNDGFAAVYAVRNAVAGDLDDGYNLIILDNGNVAERLIPNPHTLVDSLDMERTPFVTIRPDGSYIASQCMCVAGDYLIVSHYITDSSPTRLYVLDIENKTVESYADFSISHANTICYNPDDGCLYSIWGYAVYKITLSGNTLTSMTTLSSARQGIAMSYRDGHFYIVEADTHILLLTDDFTNFDELFTIDDDTLGIAGQGSQGGLLVDDTYIYYTTNGSDNVDRITVWSKANHQRVRQYRIPRKNLGEIEDIDIYDGNLIINFNRRNYGSGAVYVTPLFDDVSGFLDPLKAGNRGEFNITSATSVYVEDTGVVAFPDGSESNPFNTYNFAVQTINNLNLNARMYLKGSLGDINIYNQRNTLWLDFVSGSTAGVIHLTRGTYILTGTTTAKQIYADGSLVTGNLGGSTLDGQSDTAYAIQCYRGFVALYIGTVKDYTTRLARTLQGFVNVTVDTITNTERNVNGDNVILNGFLNNASFPLAENTNLNDLKVGNTEYYSTGTSVTSTLSNCPVSANRFTLTVKKTSDSSCIQTLVADSGTAIYVRAFGGSTWNSWRTYTGT